MKAFRARYSNGSFIDVESGNIINLIQDEVYIINGNEKSFASFGKIGDELTALNSFRKKEWVDENYTSTESIKILDANELLCFRVGLGKKNVNREVRNFLFTCKLLEDLYLYKLRDQPGEYPKNWRLADCICEIDKCIYGDLKIYEKVKAQSLNKLFDYIVQIYFRMERSASANVFNTFFLYDKNVNYHLHAATWGQYETLAKIRIAKVSEYIPGNK
jgi:hypothetical protein